MLYTLIVGNRIKFLNVLEERSYLLEEKGLILPGEY